MIYKQTHLWIAAFEKRRKDSTVQEQAKLAECYDAMRERASALVAKISKDLPHLTIHDVTHLDALWEMASIASSDSVDLNPAEAFLFGGAVLLHDAAMTLAAFPGGMTELRQQTEWQDLHARYASVLPPKDEEAAREAENRATADALRLLHAKQAESLPSASWIGPQKQPMFLIENQQIRNFYGPKIGKVAYSHWWPIARLEEELSGTLGALPGVTSCTIDLLKVACLLRVADAMHLDQRRARAFDFALVQPSGVSADHWKFQERMAKPFVQGDALIYTAQPPFEADIADAWWTAFDALQMVDRELHDVDRLLRDRQKPPLAVRRVDGVQTPSDLARTVETVGWTPVDSTVRVTDVPNIVATLGGSKLYGSEMAAPVRELIQNGLDAITARRRLQSRPSKWGELMINLRKREDGYWLSFEDNGVGMSHTVLTGPLIDFGNSFWKSSLAIQEFPGLVSSGMKARGKYGIGFFSVFMLGDHVRVVTRRYDRDARSARVLEFRHGLGSRPNMRDADPKEVPLDGGTRVEVRLRNDPREPEGLLYRKMYYRESALKLSDMVASIAPACDVTISVSEDEETIGTTAANDWLEVDSSILLRRITGENAAAKQEWEKLVELRDEEGRIYGRARIDPYPIASRGLLTVDGLAASKVSSIAGILIGTEITASRNSAIPIVPAHVLAAWASEQAIAFGTAAIPDEEKARVAAIVASFGGDVAELPVVRWEGEWMNSKRFSEAMQLEEEVTLHTDTITHEEDDVVTKREFEASFEVYGKVAQTVGGSLAYEWVSKVTQGKGATPARIIERLLVAVWGEVEEDDDTMVVGDVNGSEIYRTVTVYKRGEAEELLSGDEM
ncbi:ATPase domain-containing protein [Agrobacterium sp. ATCC 31749]|uniref:HD domain-containing protein n=1 Tax=unclassified Agrobacterium TaxID=2632611 RepID=UPI00020DBF53|nr:MULTISPECIES: ATP-binding protein [unclassified Agrobacterium]EGL62691.1 ATPase domain-containing protein [Agrobacterium sp. ATCC 31749]QKW96874.1 ATP-binding protein [Agrobacterium sp. CGMCC 11546]